MLKTIYPKRSLLLRLACIMLCSWTAVYAQPGGSMSLDSLLNIRISSASKYEQTTAEAPASITLITSEEILRYGYDNLTEVLQAIRGVYITHDRNYEYLGVRGFSRATEYTNRVVLMVDGHVENEDVWGGACLGIELSGLSLDDVERVELIRGPASALYGSYPMLGMINIVLKDGHTQQGAHVSAETGSYGRLQTTVGVGTRTRGGLDFNLGFRLHRLAGQNLYYPEYDSVNQGIAEKMDWRQAGGIHLKLSWKNFSLVAMATHRIMGVPTASYETVFNDRRFDVLDDHSLLNLQYRRELGANKEVTVRTFGNHYQYKGNYPYDSAGGGLYREWASSFWAGVDARLRWDLLSNNRLVMGTEYVNHFSIQYGNADESGYLYEDNFRFFTFSVYVQDEYQPFSWLSLTGGARFDRNMLNKQAVTPRLAAVIYPTQSTTLKLLYGQAFRAPSVYEALMYNPIFSLGNPNLSPERMQAMEIVAEQRIRKNGMAALSLYRNNLRNLIEQETLGDSIVTFVNRGAALGYGAEIELNARTGTGIQAYSSFAIQKITNTMDDMPLRNSPQILAKGGLSFGFLKHFRFSPELLYESGRETEYNSFTPAYLLCNANLRFQPVLKRDPGAKESFAERWSLAFKVRNLLNTPYAHPGGLEHLMPSIPQNGRNYTLKLRYDF